jgi:Flp pilus assembly protein TadG
MRSILQSKNRRRGSIMVMFTLMLPVLMMMVGLAIDRTMLFIVEAKLDASVDAAALGAGRLLGTTANTPEIAGEFLAANFPASYWGSYAFTPTITSTDVLSLHTIMVGASVKVPLLFMRMFGPGYNLVTSYAQATRRDSRIVMVLDRSGSMAAQISNLKNAATQFTTLFTGADELGLVVLGSSSIVAYPTARPYNTSPTSAGGPDNQYATEQTGGDMVDMIAAITAGGDTSTAEALSLAYIELQKGHNRDLLANGVDDRLNSIVFFTDGMPTDISVNLNTTSTLAGSSIKTGSGSACQYQTTTTPADEMIGWIGDWGFGVSNGYSSGLYLLASQGTATTLWWMQNASSDVNVISPTTPITNCAYLHGVGQNGRTTTDLTDLAHFPTYDIYNNSTTDSFYTQSWIYLQSRIAYDPTKVTSQYHLGIASWNAADNAGTTIRTQTAMNPVVIYTIGYTGDGGVDVALLERLANNLGSPWYNATQPTGVYVEANSSTDVLAAFYSVASSILRLAK